MKRRNRKRLGINDRPKERFSEELQELNMLLSKASAPELLGRLEQIVEEADSPIRRAKVICAAADCLILQGRFTEAAETFAAASGILENGPSKLWLRPALGRFEALLRVVEYPLAFEQAERIREIAMNHAADFDDLLAKSAQTNPLEIPPRPHRPTVVLTRIGNRLLGLGFIAEAKTFFEDAVLLAPNGASRARQGLAHVHLESAAPDLAERFSRESLQTGRFQAKTVASWSLLARSRHALEKAELFERDLIRALFHHQSGDVLGRSILALSIAAHSLGRDEWMTIAKHWLQTSSGPDHVIVSELIKLEIAHYKRSGDFPALGRAARRLLSTPLIAFSEARAAAKLLLRCHIHTGSPSMRRFVRLPEEIATQTGVDQPARIFMSMAQGAVEENDQQIARAMLGKAIEVAAADSRHWYSAHGGLARLETEAGRHREAANLYLIQAGSPSSPASSRIKALLNYVDALERSGDPADQNSVRQQLQPLISQIDDPFVMLDVAKRFSQAGESIGTLGVEVAERARGLADEALAATTDPGYAVSLLKRLSLREYHEIGHPSRVVERWESFDAAKREWLWMRGDDFWQYLSLVYESYRAVGKRDKATELARYQLGEPSTPPEGHAWLGSILIDSLIRMGELESARELITQVLAAAPHHTQSFLVYYWGMVDALSKGDNDKVISMARSVQRCLGRNAGFIEKMRARGVIANLVLQDLDAGSLHADFSPKNESERAEFLEFLETDLACFRP